MEVISKLTGINLGKLEGLFPSKNELLNDLFDNHLGRRFEKLTEKLPSKMKKNPEQNIKKVIDFYFDLFDDKRVLRAMLMKNLTSDSQKKMKKYESQILKAFKQLLKGKNKEARASIIFDSIIGNINSYKSGSMDISKRELKSELTHMILKMMDESPA